MLQLPNIHSAGIHTQAAMLTYTHRNPTTTGPLQGTTRYIPLEQPKPNRGLKPSIVLDSCKQVHSRTPGSTERSLQ